MGTTGGPAPGRAVGVPGLLTTAVGVLLVVLAFTGLDWYGVTSSGADSATETTFANLKHSVDAIGGAKAAAVYFDWLSWTLLIAGIVIGALANLRTPVTDLLRILGFVVGAAGIGATYYALLQYTRAQQAAGAAKHNPLFNGTWGLTAALLGFGLIGVGAVLGPGKPS